MSNLVIVSNGHGEDLIGAALGAELRALGHAVRALPLVGRGGRYETAGIEVLGPRLEMPSGGFVLNRRGAFLEDLRAGWLPMTLGQWGALLVASRGAATLAVGDIYGVGVGRVFGSRPLFHMQPLVSIRAWGDDAPWDVRRSFVLPERLAMRGAERVYARDPESADWLRARGVAQAVCLGNPMLDAVSGDNVLEVPPPYLLLLPGSRGDAYESLPTMLEACRLLHGTGLTPVVAWAGLPLGVIKADGWALDIFGRSEGIVAQFSHPDGTAVYLAQNAFRAALLGARLALSTSGTAAEQAAGYGVPLVGFPTSGPQYTRGFAQAQKRLLRDALTLTEPHAAQIAQAATELLQNQELRLRAEAAGKAAMGEPGAARRIALDIHQRLSSGA